MRFRSIFLSLLLAVAVTDYSNAQVGGYLRSKVNRAIEAGANAADKKANEEIDKSAEKAVDNAAKKVEEDIEKKSEEDASNEEAGKKGSENKEVSNRNDNAGGFNLGNLMGGGPVTSKYRESYSFNNMIFMQAELYDGKEVMKMDYYIYFNDNSADAGIEAKIAGGGNDDGQVTMNTISVFDGINKSFLMLTDMGATRFGMISDVPEESSTGTQASQPSVTKTGNSKTIAGYKCDEYIVREAGKKEYNKLWITRDLKLLTDKRTFQKAGISSFYDTPELREGTSLAMESYDEKEKLVMKSETREVKPGISHTISTAGFPLRQMDFSQTGTQK